LKTIALIDEWRKNLLLKQFHLDKSTWAFKEIKKSLTNIYNYVSIYTNIVYIEFIDEEILYNYIKYHSLNYFNEIDFRQVINDVKNYILFLKMNRCEYIPNVDLSVKNNKLWTSLSKRRYDWNF
jgi:hypothetical protein